MSSRTVLQEVISQNIQILINLFSYIKAFFPFKGSFLNLKGKSF